MTPKKSLQPDDSDTLNPMADVKNYAAGAEDGLKPEDDTGDETNGDDGEKSKPYPDEIALPKESDDNDELVLKQ